MRSCNEPKKMADTTQVNAAPDIKTDIANMVSPTESTGAIDGASPQSPSEPVNGTTPDTNHHPKTDHLPATNGGVTPSEEKKTPTGFKSPPKQDPIKQKEREERVRMLREKQAEEQKKKLDELKEAQRRAQDIREKQLQERQRKILESRKKEEEHRALVEERRRRMEQEENEKRVAVLKKNAERETKLESARQSMQQQVVFGFGSSTRRMVCDAVDPTQRASSQGSLLRRSPNDTLDGDAVDAHANSPHRRAISACSLSRKSASAHSEKNQELLTVGLPPDKRLSLSTGQLSPAKGKRLGRHSMGTAGSTSNLRITSLSTTNVATSKPSPKKTRLSGSTSNLGSATIPGESRMKPAASMGQVSLRHRTPPPNYRVRGNQSENSSGDRSPVRKRRPHSIAGRLPGYAAPTTASEARTGRSEEKKITATSLMAKNRSKSADVSTMRISRSSQDIKKSIDRLSMPKVPREPRDRSMPNRPAPKPTATPPVKMQPAVPRVLPRETNKAPSKDKNKQPTPQKGPVKANHNVNVSTAKKPSKPATPQKRSTPSPKMGSPAKEKPTPPGTSPAVSPPPGSSPVPGEEKKDEEKKVDEKEEYKAKMAAKRKEMREKAEREAEEKRLREEEEKRLEEERIRREEEEERQRIAEEERLAAEARKAEEERLQKAIEEAERKRREEEERAEEDRIAREEAEKFAKEEAERKEQERLEKLRKEEEERQERRKRLEMIMNRVRPDQAEKSDSPSPTKSVSPPSATTPERELPSNVMTASGSFKSPLLQQMMSKKAQAETGQEQAAEDAVAAPSDETLVQAEPEVEAAVASETSEAVTEVAEVPDDKPAIVQPPEATTDVDEVKEEAPVEAPAAEAEAERVPETQPESEEEKVDTAETQKEDEENVAQEVVTSAIEEAVAEVGQPVTNGDVESHDTPQSDNSSPAKGSPTHSPRDSNNTSTSVSLDVSPNSSAPGSPKREGASSADEGAAEKAERPFSPASDEDKPKFKSPLLQRMIGSKEKSASKALEEMKKTGDSTTSSSSSSPVPPKEDAEQSMPAELNSDIAELNQVSVEINSDSVAQDSVPTLNGVNHTEDLNEVSKSICDVNQKKEDISEVSQVMVDDCSSHVDSSELCADSDAKALTKVSDAHFEVRIAGDDHIEVIKTEMLDVGSVEGAGLDLSANLETTKDDQAAALPEAVHSEDLSEITDMGHDASDTILDTNMASSDDMLTKDANPVADADVQSDADVKTEDAEAETAQDDNTPLDASAEVEAKSLPIVSCVVEETEGILERDALDNTGDTDVADQDKLVDTTANIETNLDLEGIDAGTNEDTSEVDIVVTGATPRSADEDDDQGKESDENVQEKQLDDIEATQDSKVTPPEDTPENDIPETETAVAEDHKSETESPPPANQADESARPDDASLEADSPRPESVPAEDEPVAIEEFSRPDGAPFEKESPRVESDLPEAESLRPDSVLLDEETMDESPRPDSAPADEESPRLDNVAVEESPRLDSAPAEEESPQADDASVEESSRPDSAPGEEESPRLDSAPAEESPRIDDTSVEESPRPDSAPVEEESPRLDDVSVEESPRLDSAPAEEESPRVDDDVSVEESPRPDSAPAEEESPRVDDDVSVEESPRPDSAPAEEESPRVDDDVSVKSPRPDSAPAEESPRLDDVSVEESPRLDSAPAVESPRIDDTSVEVSPRPDSAPAEESPRLDDVSVEESPRLDSAPAEEESPRVDDDVSVEESPRPDSAPAEEESPRVDDDVSVEESPRPDSAPAEEESPRVDDDVSVKSPRPDSAPAEEESPRLDDVSVEESTRLDSAPAVESPRIDDTSVEVSPRPDSAPAEESPRLDDVSVEESPRLDSAPVEEPPRINDVSVEESPGLDDGSVEESSRLDSAPAEESHQADDASVKDSPRPDSAPDEESPRLDSAPVESPMIDDASVEDSPRPDSTPGENEPPRLDDVSVESPRLDSTPAEQESPRVDVSFEESPRPDSAPFEESPRLDDVSVEESPRLDIALTEESPRVDDVSVEESPRLDSAPVESPMIDDASVEDSPRPERTPAGEESPGLDDLSTEESPRPDIAPGKESPRVDDVSVEEPPRLDSALSEEDAPRVEDASPRPDDASAEESPKVADVSVDESPRLESEPTEESPRVDDVSLEESPRPDSVSEADHASSEKESTEDKDPEVGQDESGESLGKESEAPVEAGSDIAMSDLPTDTDKPVGSDTHLETAYDGLIHESEAAKQPLESENELEIGQESFEVESDVVEVTQTAETAEEPQANDTVMTKDSGDADAEIKAEKSLISVEQTDLDCDSKDTEVPTEPKNTETDQTDKGELHLEAAVDTESHEDESSQQSLQDNDKDSQSDADGVSQSDADGVSPRLESLPVSDASQPDSARSVGAEVVESQSVQDSEGDDDKVEEGYITKSKAASEKPELDEKNKETEIDQEEVAVTDTHVIVEETNYVTESNENMQEEKTDPEKPLVYEELEVVADAQHVAEAAQHVAEAAQLESKPSEKSDELGEIVSHDDKPEPKSLSAEDDGEPVELSLSNASQLSEKMNEVDSQKAVESVEDKAKDLATTDADTSAEVVVSMMESKEDVQEKADLERTEKSNTVVGDSTESQPHLEDPHHGDIKSATNIIEEAPEAKVPEGDTPEEEQYGDDSDIVLPKESQSDEVNDAKVMHESEPDISFKEESVSLSTKDESMESEDEVIDHLKFNISSTIFEEVSEVVDESKDESDEDEVSDVPLEQPSETMDDEGDDEGQTGPAAGLVLGVQGDSDIEEHPDLKTDGDKLFDEGALKTDVVITEEINTSDMQPADEDAFELQTCDTHDDVNDTHVDNSVHEADGTHFESISTDHDLSLDTSLPEATGLSLEAELVTADVKNIECEECSYQDSPRSVQSIDSVKELKALNMQTHANVSDEVDDDDDDESDSECKESQPTDVTNITQDTNEYDDDFEVKSDNEDDREVESDNSQSSPRHPQHVDKDQGAAMDYDSEEDKSEIDNERGASDMGATGIDSRIPLESQKRSSFSDEEIEEEISDENLEQKPDLDKSFEQYEQDDEDSQEEQEEEKSASEFPSNAALLPQSKFDYKSEGDSDNENLSHEQSPGPSSKPDQFSYEVLCRDSASSIRDVSSDVRQEPVNLNVHAANPESMAHLDNTIEGDVSPVVSSDLEHLHADSVHSKDIHEADLDVHVGNIQFSDKENNENYRYDDEQDEDINIDELKLKFDVDHDDLESVKRRALELGESSGEAEAAERRGSRREYTSSGSSSPSQSPKKYMRSDASSPQGSIQSDEENGDDTVLGNSAEQGALLDFSDSQQKGQVTQDLLNMSMTSNRDDLLTSSPYDGDDEAASKNPFVSGDAFRGFDAASKNPFVSGDVFRGFDDEEGKQSSAPSTSDQDPFGARYSDQSQEQADDPWKQFTSQGQDLMSMSMAAQEKSIPDDFTNASEDPESSSHPFADPWGAAFGGHKGSVDFNMPADKLASAGDHTESGLGFSDKLQSGWQTEYGQAPESAMDVDSPAGGDVSFGKIQSEMYRRHFEDGEEDEEEDVETDEDEEREAGVDNSAKAPTSALLLNEDPDLINRNQQPAPLNTEPLDENNASTISAAAANEDNVQEILSL